MRNRFLKTPRSPAVASCVRSAAEKDAAAAGSTDRIARGHHAPAFGVVCRALGVETGQAMRSFMFLVARDVLSAATRQDGCLQL